MPPLATANAGMAHLSFVDLRHCCFAAELSVAVMLPPIEVVCVEPPALAERF